MNVIARHCCLVLAGLLPHGAAAALASDLNQPQGAMPPLPGAAPDPARERACLATAIYYESAHEPLAGQEAVAQVILNRTRQSDFPRTVCGVVWQGHERRTGCQFSFTCDGSLARAPAPLLWRNALAVADRMLASAGAAPFARALNYHADYVSPRWRLSLVEAGRIGRHIFYNRRAGESGPVVTGGADLTARQPVTVWGISLDRAARASAAP